MIWYQTGRVSGWRGHLVRDTLGKAFSLSRWTVGLRYLRRGYSRIPESQPFYESEQFVALGVGLVSRDFYEVEELVQFRAYDYLTKGWNIALIGGMR